MAKSKREKQEAAFERLKLSLLEEPTEKRYEDLRAMLRVLKGDDLAFVHEAEFYYLQAQLRKMPWPTSEIGKQLREAISGFINNGERDRPSIVNAVIAIKQLKHYRDYVMRHAPQIMGFVDRNFSEETIWQMTCSWRYHHEKLG